MRGRTGPRAAIAAVAMLGSLVLALAREAAAQGAADIRVGGALIHVELDSGAFRNGAEEILSWVRRSAGIVEAYYGEFPTPHLTVRVNARTGDGVGGGQTFAHPAALIRVQAGREVTAGQLLADWVLVHEMIHLALPDTGDAHAWLSEGLATYVEGVARVQAGNRSEADVWAEEIRQMPKGLPQSGDRGLDHTHTWARTYWGGALFCLMADVEIRQRSHGHSGLEDALRSVLHASGGLAADWPIERVLRTGDEAVGGTTLEDLYARMKDEPVAPDLMQLWQQLGVEPQGATVELSDTAPLAGIRRAIMARSPPPARKTP